MKTSEEHPAMNREAPTEPKFDGNDLIQAFRPKALVCLLVTSTGIMLIAIALDIFLSRPFQMFYECWAAFLIMMLIPVVAFAILKSSRLQSIVLQPTMKVSRVRNFLILLIAFYFAVLLLGGAILLFAL